MEAWTSQIVCLKEVETSTPIWPPMVISQINMIRLKN